MNEVVQHIRSFALASVELIVSFKRWSEKLLLSHDGRVKPEGIITLEALLIRFPRYLRTPPGHVQCGQGWRALIWDLCTAIEAMEHLGMPRVSSVQTEGRLGGLFIRVGSPSLLVRELVKEIEHKAAMTCEECGANGKLRLGHGFAKTLCAEHAKVRKPHKQKVICPPVGDRAPKLVFLDTEFTDLEYPQLISIALVAETGESFYAELADGWTPENCSSFVCKNVLPQLTGGDFPQETGYARRRLSEWLTEFCCPVRVVTDAPGYDWVLTRDLLLDAVPPNLYPEPIALYSESFPELVPLLQEARAKAFSGSPPHHAMQDALALREAWEVMKVNVHPAIMDQYLRHL